MLRSVRGGRARRRVRSADGDTRFGGKASARHTCREINGGLPARLVSDGTGLEALTQSVATTVMNCCVFYGALKLNASAK